MIAIVPTAFIHTQPKPPAPITHIAALGKAGKLSAIPELYRVMTGPRAELRIPAAAAIQRICRTVIGDTGQAALSPSNPFIAPKIDRTKLPINLRRFLQVDPALLVAYENTGRSPEPLYKRHLIEDEAVKRGERDYEDKSEDWLWQCGTFDQNWLVFSEICQTNPKIVLDLLQTPSFGYKGALLRAIGKCPASFEPTLIQLSRSTPSSVRIAAIYAFPRKGSKDIVDALVAAAKDERASVRRAVVFTVQATAPAESDSILATLMNDPNPTIREEAKQTRSSPESAFPIRFK